MSGELPLWDFQFNSEWTAGPAERYGEQERHGQNRQNKIGSLPMAVSRTLVGVLRCHSL